MPADSVITMIVLFGMFMLLAADRLPPAGVVLGALVVLTLFGVIGPEVGFAGFGNSAPLTVAALYVVAGGARRVGLLAPVSARLLGGTGGRASLARLTAPVAALSAFFNNTPLVAMLTPEVAGWARRNRLPVSRFLMPLSFAAILGGTVTVIGTSTNLVASGVLEQQGRSPLGLFELTPIGLPVAVVGLVVLVLVGPRVLPDRSDPAAAAITALRDYALQLEVTAGGPLDGVSIGDAGLRNLSGVYLADIIRGDRHMGPVGPQQAIRGGDVLRFVGDVTDVLDLRSRPGLQTPVDEQHGVEEAQNAHYCEAVIGRGSPLVGHTLKEVGGRDGYRATAIAISRAGTTVEGKLGEVELHVGDTLVLLADRDLRMSRRAMEDFLLVAPIDDSVPVVGRRAPMVGLSLVAFVVLAAFELTSTLEAALVAAGIVVMGRVLSFTDAKRSVDLDVVILVAAALGLGAAVETSGLAQSIADRSTDLLGAQGDVGLVVGILLTTVILTEVVTNNAAVAVVAPIAIRVASAADIDPRVMVMGVAVMASCSFLTPIGYQTNAMIYGPGGYKFADFFRTGIVISLAVLSTTTAAVMVLG